MINLKTEEFVLDMNTLQALQQLLQWVGDFVLYLLASLPNQVRRPGGPVPSALPHTPPSAATPLRPHCPSLQRSPDPSSPRPTPQTHPAQDLRGIELCAPTLPGGLCRRACATPALTSGHEGGQVRFSTQV